jgi:hypothetical protein
VKIQIVRLSPHQNAKVLAVLLALVSLLFAVPMFFVFLFMPPGIDSHGNPIVPPPDFIPLLFPVIYLVVGYVMVAVGCWFYNLIFRFLGGIEFETRER